VYGAGAGRIREGRRRVSEFAAVDEDGNLGEEGRIR